VTITTRPWQIPVSSIPVRVWFERAAQTYCNGVRADARPIRFGGGKWRALDQIDQCFAREALIFAAAVVAPSDLLAFVVISGVGPGLGRAMATVAADEGACVVLGARNADFFSLNARTPSLPSARLV